MYALIFVGARPFLVFHFIVDLIEKHRLHALYTGFITQLLERKFVFASRWIEYINQTDCHSTEQEKQRNVLYALYVYCRQSGEWRGKGGKSYQLHAELHRCIDLMTTIILLAIGLS